jgi:hypothetical protein
MPRLRTLIREAATPVLIKCLDKIVNRSVSKTATFPIDFVIMWVDCNDPKWKADYQSVFHALDYDPARYRDMKILKYWFRAVERYAPWVNKIYFVTNGQSPKWLNTSHDKIVHVRHEDFIPEKYLPTFSSRTIEFCTHLIKGLSEHFVLFNDDMFINGPIEPSYYFQDGLPIDNPRESIVASTYSERDRHGINLNMAADIHILNRFFNRKEIVHKHWLKWLPTCPYYIRSYMSLWPYDKFSHFSYRHVEQPYRKATFKSVWETIPEEMDRTCSHKRRHEEDLNIYLMRYWHLASNQWTRRYDDDKYLFDSHPTLRNLDRIKAAIESTQIKSLCINDSPVVLDDEFEIVCKELVLAFEKKYPEKSAFEI